MTNEDVSIKAQLAAFEKASAYAVFPFQIEGVNGDMHYHGIGKRELFAAMAMQGILSGSDDEIALMSSKTIGEWAVQQADALLAALDVSPPDRHHGGTTLEERENPDGP